jgi:hypothetical protein
MRSIKRFTLVALLAALSLVALLPAQGQDDMMEGIVCDSDLILSLYTAEYHFDYAAVYDTVVMAGGTPGFDLAALDHGQFTPLFDSMMGMMQEDMSMGMMDADAMTALVEMMSMSMDDMGMMMMESMEGMDMSMYTTLAPAEVAGEAAECSALRANLRQFYTALAYQSSMMMEAM